MKTFYVEAKINVHEYPDTDMVIEYRNVILATDIAQASKILDAYWDNRSSSYETSYTIINRIIREALQ